MPSVSRNRDAFTLLELLIVVLLIAVLYGVFIDKLQQNSTDRHKDAVTLKTLKSLLGTLPSERRREVICLKPCTECAIFLDGKPLEESKLKLFRSEPTVWHPDRYGQYQAVEFTPLIDPEHGVKRVCFRFSLFRNGSSSSYIVQTDPDHFLVFRAFAQSVTSFESMDDAQSALDSERFLPTEQRDYLF